MHVVTVEFNLYVNNVTVIIARYNKFIVMIINEGTIIRSGMNISEE